MPNPDYLPPEIALPAAVALVVLYLLAGWKQHRS